MRNRNEYRPLQPHQAVFFGGVGLLCNAVMIFWLGVAAFISIGFYGQVFGIIKNPPPPTPPVVVTHTPPTAVHEWLSANERHNEFLREQEAQRQRQADYAAQGLDAFGSPKPAPKPVPRYVADGPEHAIYYP